MRLQKENNTFALSPPQTGGTSSIRITSFVVKCNFKRQPLQRDFIRKRSTLIALVASSSEEYGGFRRSMQQSSDFSNCSIANMGSTTLSRDMS